MTRLATGFLIALAMLLASILPAQAQKFSNGNFGPYNADILEGGWGLEQALPNLPKDATIPTGAPFTLTLWVNLTNETKGRLLIAGLGQAAIEYNGGFRRPGPPDTGPGIYIGADNGILAFWTNAKSSVTSSVIKLPVDEWHFLATSFDGTTLNVYLDGIKEAGGKVTTPALKALMQLGPRNAFAGSDPHFGGKLADVMVVGRALGDEKIAAMAKDRPDFSLINFVEASPDWSVQTRQMVGQPAPQDPWTLPKSNAPFSKPVTKPEPGGPALAPEPDDIWIVNGWRLAEAPKVEATGAAISTDGYDASKWYAATVPGTVLTTLIDRGVYPDPDYGLNNMAIPESLNKQDYWYRTEFTAPASFAGRHLRLTFNGINYAAEIWVNGENIGQMKGAFIRGQFDVTGVFKPGAANTIAVKVSPPPHPGIPHEQSIKAGAGNNGGMMALDGPTFIASEGWDWIPAVRDRETGLWQNVELHATGPVRIGDVHVVTALPKPDNSVGTVEVTVPLENLSDQPLAVTVDARFGDIQVSKTVTAQPGKSAVVLSPEEFPALTLSYPVLWWPNGYGDPALYTLQTEVSVDGAISDRNETRFGIRQITYEISLIDSKGRLRRVEVDPTKARALGQNIIDVRHEAIRKLTPGFGSWAASFFPGAETSLAVTPDPDTRISPSLIIKVNGVRIAVRGGNWGMDDWLKRVSRDRLEPYFRLSRDAHLNAIRNWVGQSTEKVFYDLADEYGQLVLNEFWDSTENFQIEPEDPQLFLANVADVIKRFRNHPSIALWLGRNEGVPQPIINAGIMRLVQQLDGTRHYQPASLAIDLAMGGPYAHQPPSFYYNYWGDGFTMEVGVPSFPTLESFKAFAPKQDWWPITDTWAYHDWHQAGNGDTHGFLKAITGRFGAPTSLEDFDRKAQFLDYEAHRAVYEGFNAGLWSKNSGRMLWMTQPAWPSTVWQIYSHDYDTQASYYATMHALESVHVQMDLADHRIQVIHATQGTLLHATLKADIYDLKGRRVGGLQQMIDVPADDRTEGPVLNLDSALAASPIVLVRLELIDPRHEILSQNSYWVARDDADDRLLTGLKTQPVSLETSQSKGPDGRTVSVRLKNTGTEPAVEAKLTLLNPDGSRILPAYYSDNYVTLLPGETHDVTINYPFDKANGAPSVRLRGWNVKPATVTVANHPSSP